MKNELLILQALAFLCQEAERNSKYGSSKEGLQIRVDLDTAIKNTVAMKNTDTM
jgi:hypothetical protein